MAKTKLVVYSEGDALAVTDCFSNWSMNESATFRGEPCIVITFDHHAPSDVAEVAHDVVLGDWYVTAVPTQNLRRS